MEVYENARELPFYRKCIITFILSILTFTVTFASSVFTAAIPVCAVEFKTTETVMLLGMSLYVLGFASGPALWGPMGEVLGRKIPIMVGFAIFTLLQIPTALTHNLVGLLLCRFFAGCMGAAPLSLVSAVYVDIWDTSARGTAAAIYSIACFLGPTLGPIVSAVLTNGMGWRWTAWIVLIIGFPIGALDAIFVPETYAVVLKKEGRPTFSEFVTKYLVRPLDIIRHEPIFDVMTIYHSLAYGILYLTFYCVPYIFRTERGWSSTDATLPFIGILVGVIIAAISQSYFYRKWLTPRLIARGGKVHPEDRLPPIIVGSLLLPTGLFWLAWTSRVSWVAQAISLCFVGAGIMLIFSGCLVYLMDTYALVAASALAANVCVRSIVAAGLPIAAPSMYENLGVGWATSLLGFLCVAILPSPFVFLHYGERLRSKGKYSRGLTQRSTV